MDAARAVLLGVGAAAAVAVFWCLVLALCAHASGWRRLADRWPGPAALGDGVTSGLSARIGLFDYSGVIEGRADDLGLSLALMLLFRPFHSAISIPWSEMRIERLAGWSVGTLRLTFPSLPGVRLRIRGRARALVEPYIARGRCGGEGTEA